MPIGPSALSASSQVMNTTPPSRYAWEFRMSGRYLASHVSPCATLLRSGLQLSCISLQTFGVMKLYRATELLARSLLSSSNGRMCSMQYAESGFLRLVTSSKNTNGLCFTTYGYLSERGQSFPEMPSW